MQHLLDKAKELMQYADRYGIDEIVITDGQEKIHLSKNQNISQPLAISNQSFIEQAIKEEATSNNQLSVDTSSFLKINSPMVGTFYRAPSPEAPPFKKEGDMVSAGDTVCIVEAMKIMNQIKSPHSGILRKVHAKNAEIILKDQILMEIEPV